MGSSTASRAVNFFGLLMIIAFLTYVIPQSIGLGAGGFDSKQTVEQMNFFLVFIVGFIILISAWVIELVVKRGDSRYGNSLLFAEPGETPALPFFKRFSQFQIAWLSAILFGIFGLFAFVTNQSTFTGIATLEQQFTPTAQLLFSTFLVPGAENLGLAAVLVTGLFIWKFYVRKNNVSSQTYQLVAWVLLPLLGGSYWVLNHLLRYAGQDFQLVSVFLFGLVQSLFVVFTGSFIVGYLMHMANNFFFDVRDLFGSETVVFVSVAILVLLAVGYFFVYRKNLFGGRKSEASIV